MKNYRIYLPAILSCLLMLSCIKEKPVEVIPVTGISFDAEEIDRANTLTIIGIDEQFELSAIVEPANANIRTWVSCSSTATSTSVRSSALSERASVLYGEAILKSKFWDNGKDWACA